MQKEYKELDIQLKNAKSRVKFGENILPKRNESRDNLKIERLNLSKNMDYLNEKILNLKKNIERNLPNKTKKRNHDRDMEISL